MGRVRKGRSSRDKGLRKGRGGASVTVAEQMSGEGSEQRSGPAEAILARRSSRPEMPGWLLKEGADEEDESGSEYDPAEELPEPDEEAAEYEVDGVVRGRKRTLRAQPGIQTKRRPTQFYKQDRHEPSSASSVASVWYSGWLVVVTQG